MGELGQNEGVKCGGKGGPGDLLEVLGRPASALAFERSNKCSCPLVLSLVLFERKTGEITRFDATVVMTETD